MKILNLIAKKDESIISIREEDIDMDYFETISESDLCVATNTKIAFRTKGAFNGKALYLSDRFDYILGIDSDGIPILVPLEKK